MRLFNWLKLLFQKPVVVIQRKKHPLWYNVALKERGVTEIRGNKHNDRILEYHQASNLKATTDEIAWCSSFVNWCLTQAGFFNPHSAAARSYLKWGAECKPYTGCVVGPQEGAIAHGRGMWDSSSNRTKPTFGCWAVIKAIKFASNPTSDLTCWVTGPRTKKTWLWTTINIYLK